jgi:hypothetical protein
MSDSPRGGMGFFGGLLMCGAPPVAQAALLQAIAGHKEGELMAG